MSDFWEEEHEHESSDSGSDWKTEDENPYEGFILDFLENLEIKNNEEYHGLKKIVDVVLERKWYSEESETEATTAIFSVCYVVSLGSIISPELARGMANVIKKCVRNDIKAENERN
jgi:hypothetical protein